MKRKVNFVAIGNLIGLVLSGATLVKYFYVLMILPFISRQVTGMTTTGVLVLIIAVYVFTKCLNYTIERLK